MTPDAWIYPDFTLAAYRELLTALAARWRVGPVTLNAAPGSLLLRHDVDFSPALALRMAEVEAELGLRSTYFVALHLLYNPHAPQHAAAIRRMAALGHALGLHYDGPIYDAAPDPAAQLALLQQHVAVLQDLAATQIGAIARHNPSTATGSDPFAASPYLNAYDPALFGDTVYLSDSCRAWRDGGLSACWAEPTPQRIYLLVHPEVWLGEAGTARLAYLPWLQAQVMQEQATFFADVRAIWQGHAGGVQHDRREAAP
ncbi:MAG: hypothetical protein WAZ19_15620 [Anaerolineae bacterium]